MSPGTRERPRPPRVRPERQHRGDVVATVLLAVLVIGGAVLLWGTSDAAHTSSRAATEPIAAPPPASGLPAAFVESWRAPSGATTVPVVAGPAIVTAEANRVVGRDARTGDERWSYERDRRLCTVAAGFPHVDDATGRVLALYAGGSGYCSELTALRPDTGERAGASNPDVRPGTRLVASGPSVVATGSDYLEVLRSDLVTTLQYGAVPVQNHVGKQPRPECARTSVAIGADRLGFVERCPGEASDRLTVVAADGDDAEEPEVAFSVPLPGTGAMLVAVSADTAAVALPGPQRLLLFDHAGQQIGRHELNVPAADLADPPGGVPAVESDGEQVYWWTGSRTIALDGRDLTPLWSLPDTLGPAVAHGGELLVPVADGLLVVDSVQGTAERTIPVERPDVPVRLASLGEVLLEQRAGELVALRPTGRPSG